MFDARTIGIIVRCTDDRKVVSSCLRKDGHDTLLAEDIAEVELYGEDWEDISLLIVDTANAEGAVEAVGNLERLKDGRHLPILAIVPEDEGVAPWLERGFDDAIRMPLECAELRSRVGIQIKLQETAEQRFQALFESTPVGIFRLSSEGRLLVANPAFVGLLGFDSFDDLRAAAPSHIRSPLPPHEPAATESVWIRKDGTPVHVLQRTYPVLSPTGELLCYEGMIEDLSQRQMIEEALKEHAARLTLALDAARMGDFEYNFRTDEIECAFLVYRLLGYAEEPIARSSDLVLSRVHPDDLDGLRRSLRGAISEDSTWQHEFRVVWPDETTHWIVARGEVFRGADKRPERLIGVVRDATAEKKLRLDLIAAKQEAEKMAELKSTFLANMSHEIRTPLTAIIGFASLLSGRVPEEHRGAVYRIQQGGQRLLDTLNAVLTLARLESDQMTLELEPVDVAAEARTALRMFEYQAREKGLRLKFSASLPRQPVRAVVDRGALASILQNLIGNAIKFTEKGDVSVTVRLDDSSDRPLIWVDVADAGRGIDETFIPHIFDEFRQESSGIRREHEGAGLGLAIVRRLTQALDGELSVESKKGKGSTFSVGFPGRVVRQKPSPELHDVPDGDADAGHRPALLVVEDNEDTRELLHALLQERFDVTLAANAQEALRRTRDDTFDVVLMDINLGEGKSGEEVAALLREKPSYRNVPIIALTAYALPGDAEHFLDMGFSAHLPKPFKPSSLIEIIDRLGR